VAVLGACAQRRQARPRLGAAVVTRAAMARCGAPPRYTPPFLLLLLPSLCSAQVAGLPLPVEMLCRALLLAVQVRVL
jgi:hypothetical protein